MLKSTALAACITLLAGGAAQAGCGKAFKGHWVFEASGYGQYNRTEFHYVDTKQGAGWVESETGTGRTAAGSILGKISWLHWYSADGNLKFKNLGKGKCQITLLKPEVRAWNLGGRYDNSASNNTGIVTVSGNRLKWCWTGKGQKVLGQCNTYRREY